MNTEIKTNIHNTYVMKDKQKIKKIILSDIDYLLELVKNNVNILRRNDFQKEVLKLTLYWFEYFQKDLDLKKGVELYSKLIEEEETETKLAWKVLFGIEKFDKEDKQAESELLDGYIDTLWVILGHNYFKLFHSYSKNFRLFDEERFNIILDHINEIKTEIVDKYITNIMIPDTMFYIVWLEILKSNWTKSLELRDETDAEGKVGKVIKGNDYIAPDINKVIHTYLS